MLETFDEPVTVITWLADLVESSMLVALTVTLVAAVEVVKTPAEVMVPLDADQVTADE